jgi:hypothetical protein
MALTSGVSLAWLVRAMLIVERLAAGRLIENDQNPKTRIRVTVLINRAE